MDMLAFIVGIIAPAIRDHSSGFSCVYLVHPPEMIDTLTS